MYLNNPIQKNGQRSLKNRNFKKKVIFMNNKNGMFIKFLLLMTIGIVVSASAAVSAPGSFNNYVDVFFAMVKGTGGNLAMALIMMFSGYKAYQNATPTPLIWGAIAAVLIAASPYIANSLTTNVSTFTNLP